ncbi:MAG: GAF domain-containing protein [Planctomycetota bacterium]|nr:GAF domain-containing protein [Planctomycetota bacterium]
MSELGALALRLAEATDTSTAAARLAEHLQTLVPDAAARVYLVGPGDRCGACPRVDSCPARDRCLHLEAGLGEFARPALLDQRIPLQPSVWTAVLNGALSPGPEAMPDELRGPDEDDADAPEPGYLVLPLEAAGETLGVIGVRFPAEHREQMESVARVGSFLTATAIRLVRSLTMANRRFESLLLVNELGRKVNSILNDDLLLRQAAVDIHRTFGFHNVMIFMADESRACLELKAQASRYASPIQVQERVELGVGVIGRAFASGSTQTIDDVAASDEYVRWYADTKSEMAVPIQIGGVIAGVLNVESDHVGAFSPSDRLVLETVSNQLAIAIENARLFSMVKEREDRYRTLVESSPGAVLHLDVDGRLVYANPAASDITGHTKSKLLAAYDRLEDMAHESDRPMLSAAVDAALRGEAGMQIEFHIPHADGTLRSVRASLQPLVGEQGEPRGAVVLARDHTREKQLQDQLNQSEKLSAIGTLVSGVAHELNNPLAGILGFAQLMLARRPEEWGRGDVENIETNARRCQRIVENLLAFARQSRMSKRRANLNDVIESVLNLNEYQFRMDNIAIERDFDTTVPHFDIDVNRWQQVFINLSSNAHQALLQSHKGQRRIRFSTCRHGNEIEIRVADNGPGISDELKSRIFDPFFTTKDAGTGLGLGICFGIVEEHGGSIVLDDLAEEGATFVIRTPILEAQVFEAQLPTGPRRVASDAGSGKHVLVVDDDTYICDVVQRVLRNHGYTSDIANDGEQALKRLSLRTYDLVVTDVRMPGEFDGVDIHDRLIARDPDAGRRMLYMTGNLLDGRTTERLKDLHVRCIEKPFDIHVLAEVINDVSLRATGTDPLTLEPREAQMAPGMGERHPPGAAAG